MGIVNGLVNPEARVFVLDLADFTDDASEEFVDDVTGDITPCDITGDFIEDFAGDVMEDFAGDVMEDFDGDVTDDITGDCMEDVWTAGLGA